MEPQGYPLSAGIKQEVITSVRAEALEQPHLLSPSAPTFLPHLRNLSEHLTLVCVFSKAASLPPPFFQWALGLWLGQAGTAVPGVVLSQAVRVTATHTS